MGLARYRLLVRISAVSHAAGLVCLRGSICFLVWRSEVFAYEAVAKLPLSLCVAPTVSGEAGPCAVRHGTWMMVS